MAGGPMLVDVVVDVQTTHLDQPFTYAVSGEMPPLGSRVRVPLGSRVVHGWIVRAPASGNGRRDVKHVVEVTEDAPIPAEAIALAGWMRHRYACTFREALAAVAPRVSAKSDRFMFVPDAEQTDTAAVRLRKHFGDKSFSSLSARRALRAAGINLALTALRRKLLRLTQDGVLRRIAETPSAKKRTAKREVAAILEDAARGKGPAQRRLAVALAEASGSMPLREARHRASVGAAVIRAAAAAGMIRLEEQAARVQPEAVALTASRLVPTNEQRDAIELLDTQMQRGPVTALLQGITGSGKTFVYSRLIDRVRSRGGRAIVLVPEIALTPQTAGRFIEAFGARVGVLHSGLSHGARARVWQEAAQGQLDVVVGARSAVFAPLPNLKLIVVDEEHEASYKQDVAPRYDAAAVAAQRMKGAGGAVVLGSATPSLESYREALEGCILHVRLRRRATNAPLPSVEIVDMARQQGRERRALGAVLIAGIESRLARGEKTLLFVNRRGYAGLLLCRACGFAPRCRRCAVSLVMHQADQSLRCHICGDAFRVAATCPKCNARDLRPFGFGTQRVEEEVRELFPSARVVRMDSDSTTRQGSHERLLATFGGEGDILIGTQMIAKGLDYPTVTLVGVVAADLDLNRPDFRAAERTFSLLTQVAGRAGRAAPGSHVIVQTYAPQHYAVALAASHDYDTFAAKELGMRRELRYPPFGRLSYVIVAGVVAAEVEANARGLAAHMRAAARDVEILGPAPDVLPKARGEFRMRIAIKALTEEAMLDACAVAQGYRVAADTRATVIVDPR